MVWENSSDLVFSLYLIIIILITIFILKFTKDKTKKISNFRFFIQIAALIAVFFGLLIGPFNTLRYRPLGIAPRDRLIGSDFFGYQYPDGLSVPFLACYYPHGRTVTCVIWQIQAYIFPFWEPGIGYDAFYSTTGIERLVIAFSLLIVMSIILGRFFCGWICPFGLYMDIITRIRKVFRIQHRNFSEKN